MNVRFNPVAYLKVVFLVGVGMLLAAQTTLTSPTGATKKPAGFVNQPSENSIFGTSLFSPNRIKKDRCDEKPRPADCDVKF